MRRMTPEEIARRNEYLRKREKRERIKDEIGHGFCVVFCSPLSIALRLLAIVSKVIGYMSSLGLIYGVYCGYKVIEAWNKGMEINNSNVKNIFIFLLLPFAAYFIFYVSDKLSFYFYTKL